MRFSIPSFVRKRTRAEFEADDNTAPNASTWAVASEMQRTGYASASNMQHGRELQSSTPSLANPAPLAPLSASPTRSPGMQPYGALYDELHWDPASEILITYPEGTGQKAKAHQAKRLREWQTWSEQTIPMLLKPYMQLLNRTNNFRNLSEVRGESSHCTCDNPAKALKVVCVFLERLEVLSIIPCKCSPAALQLLDRGFFPCVPNRPSLAVDISMLEFVRELFLRTPPNNSAWCETLEVFLDKRFFKLKSRNSLRRRFSNALRWYNDLFNHTTEYVNNVLNGIRHSLRQELPRAELSSGAEPVRGDGEDSRYGIHDFVTQDTHGGPNMARPAVRTADEVNFMAASSSTSTGSSERDTDTQSQEKRPHLWFATGHSDYLRNRCPLCFGGSLTHAPNESPDIIVCLDACFQQKRRTGPDEDPPQRHPQTVFLSQQTVDDVEARVEKIRCRVQRNPPEDTDEYEPGMPLPKSVLDHCRSIFLAADELRIKASTQFFADTGLMSLLCRHDRVLWLVNLRSAGEKQFYAIALLEELLKHLHPSATVGLLYDIGCQIHRSCHKWDFLGKDHSRFIFGVSIFHAGGHEWPCQLIYHPRLRKGFGYSDGEGCERFWSSIQRLIGPLRVSGYHTRLYVLDSQVKHFDEESLADLGDWLSRKWKQCQTRKKEAEETLLEIGLDVSELRAQWEQQVKIQTTVTTRTSRNRTPDTLLDIISLQESRAGYEKDICALGIQLSNAEGNQIPVIQEKIDAHRSAADALSRSLDQKLSLLGLQQRADFDLLQDNPYLRVRANAHALKILIRNRLRDRKFELARLNRSYRQSANETKIRTQIQSASQKRQPAISGLVRKYNDLCKQLSAMIVAKKAPKNAIAPFPLQLQGLFDLDINNHIWQDLGLDDGNDDSYPAWLCDDKVKRGIQVMLQLDRGIEEEARLRREKKALQQWAETEWTVVETAHTLSFDDPDLQYLLQLRMHHLTRLCVKWKRQAKDIVCDWDEQQSWGPDEVTLKEAETLENTPLWQDSSEQSEPSEACEEDEDNTSDEEYSLSYNGSNVEDGDELEDIWGYEREEAVSPENDLAVDASELSRFS